MHMFPNRFSEVMVIIFIMVNTDRCMESEQKCSTILEGEVRAATASSMRSAMI